MRAFLRDGSAATTTRHDDLAGDAPRASAPTCASAASRRESSRSEARRAARRRGLRPAALLARLPPPGPGRLPLATRTATTAPAATAGRARSARSRPGSEGRTGYPIVDAGMRQLSREGFMHNRARLIVASFLTKDLYIDWRRGRLALLGPAQRRRDRQQRRQLAVGRRHRQRHPARTGSSTRCARPTASTPMATTCAATCRSWRRSAARRCIEPWQLGPLERQAISTTPSRSSTTTRRRRPSAPGETPPDHRIGPDGTARP